MILSLFPNNSINVPILNDDNPESNETFTIKLSNVVGAVFVPGQNVGTVTITDTLQVSVTTTLPANVENLTLTGTANINGTGNTKANIIRGNSGSNILDGKGITIYMGSNDQLIGGAGNDTYIVSGSSFQTTITENLNEGTDTVQYSSTDSFGSYTLGDNLENLILTGTGNFSGTGNSLNNVITGNSGNNFLDGGVGVDSVNYSNATAAVTVNLSTNSATGGGGSDTLFNFENVIGSNFNDTLIGSSANNTLTGAGGKDALTGGLGSDRFDYKTLTDSLLANPDNITDFNATIGNDLFLVTTARAGFTNAGAVAALDNTGIIAKLTTTNFATNFAAQFTFGTRTFVAINDATAGFSATTDAIIEVTVLTGTLPTSNFVIV
jgi:Ca2+-binding RTX toxin-like protein